MSKEIIQILSLVLILWGSLLGLCYGNSHPPSQLFDLSLSELMEVEVISASRQSEKLCDTISTTYVISGQEIRDMGARNIYDVLMYVPGITIARNRGGAYRVIMRGIGSEYSSQILFMLDNHIINDLISGGLGLLNDRLPVEDIERIEVVHGPVSSLYGANAFLGLINIITKKGEDIKGASGRVRGAWDSGGHVKNYYNIIGGDNKKNGWDLFFNFHAINGDGPELPVKEDVIGRSGYADAKEESYDLYLKAQRGGFGIKGRYYHRRGGGYFGIMNALTERSDIGTESMFIDMTYQSDIAEDLFMSAHMDVDYARVDSFYEVLPPGVIPPWNPLYPWNDRGVYTKIKAKAIRYDGEMQFTWMHFAGHRINFGLGYQYQGIFDPQTYANWRFMYMKPLPKMEDVSDTSNWLQEASRNNYAIYAQDIWRLSNSIHLTLSGRYDYYTDFGSSFNPRFGIMYNFSKDYQVRALYGKAFRAPDFGSMYIQNNVVNKGNPDIEPENIETIELAFKGLIRRSLYFQVIFFHNHLTDLIDLNNAVPRTYENLNDVRVNGIELELRYDINRQIRLWANYGMVDVDSNEGYSNVSVPYNKGSITLEWHPREHLCLNFNIYAQDESPRSTLDPRDNLDGYVLMNSTFTVQLSRHIAADFSVYNITDEDYAYPSRMNTIPGDYTAPGRTILIGITIGY